MDEDELFRINSLRRYEKRSRLVLEAHSHCEVPAGCGGAVLQWVDPASGQPVRVRATSAHSVEAQLDGARVLSTGTRLRPGPHLLTLQLRWRERTPAQASFLFVSLGLLPGRGDREVPFPQATSAPDGSWRATTREPPAGWLELAFEDSAWSPLGPATLDERALPDWRREAITAQRGRGAQALAVPAAANVWVRKRFELPEPPR